MTRTVCACVVCVCGEVMMCMCVLVRWYDRVGIYDRIDKVRSKAWLIGRGVCNYQSLSLLSRTRGIFIRRYG